MGLGGGISGLGSNSTEDESESAEEVLQSMGYRDSDPETDRADETPERSWISVLQTAIIVALVGFIGSSVVYFLITGLLAMFGLHP